MNYLVTMTDPVYDIPTEKIVRDAPALGNCKVFCYDSMWFIENPFWLVKGNQWLIKHPHRRGLNWYAWKPLIVIDAMDRFAKEGDVIMYNDADSVPIKPFSHLFEECRNSAYGVMLYRASGWKAYQWTKIDMRVCMATDTEYYHDRNHDAGVSRFCLFEAGRYTAKQFLWEWLTYLVNPRCNTFDPSVLGEEKEGFQQHRTDQAIMQDLALKYGIPLHPELDYEQGLFDQQNPRPVETRQTTAPIRGSRFRNV